jgi:type IV pilus assembly protein PilC
LAKFNYTVQDPSGGTATGMLEAPDESGAISALQAKGLLILSLQAERTDSSKPGLRRVGGGKGKVTGRELVFFGAQLSTLLNGGVPLVRSLSMIGENTENPLLASTLQQVTQDVAAGAQFYQAMGKHPNVFNHLWVSLVQAGELSGQLPRSLKQIADYMEAQEEMKTKILTALMYPAILFLISMSVLVFFIVKIVPTFAEIFDQFNLKLPPVTLAVVSISRLLTKQIVPTMVIGGGGFFILRAYIRTEAGQWAKANFMMNMPMFGTFYKNILLERLLTTMTALLNSGVSILNALGVLEGIFKDNPPMTRALAQVKNEVAQGRPISASFKKTGVLPNIATEMMMMGEESGKLPDILKTLANFYASQVDAFVRRFSSIIDPIMVVVIGALVAVIVMSIFQPIFKLSQVGAGGH